MPDLDAIRFTVIAAVPDIASGNTARQRLAGLAADRETVVVASQLAGEETAEAELTFTLGEAGALCAAVLSGDRRAGTTPGLARKLSAFALVMFRVCSAANALQHIEGFDGYPDDRETAPHDADPA